MGLAEALFGPTNPFAMWANQNRNMLGSIGSGIASGTDLGTGLAKAAQYLPEGRKADDAYATQMKAEQERQAQINETVQWLQQTNPDLAKMVEAGMPVSEAWGEALRRNQPGEGAKPIEINGQLVDPNTYQVLGDFRTPETTQVPNAPAGYQFGPDGQSLQFIPGGPADPLTAGKTTEATRRNQQLASVIEPELVSLVGDPKKGLPGTFDALADLGNQAMGTIGLGNIATSPQYQQAQNSLKTIVASYLYSVSGATANPGEVQNQVDVLTPKPGESKESVAAKKARLIAMVEAVKAAATGTPISISGGGAPAAGANYVYNPATGKLEPQ